jgi:hypothetical protein
MNRVQVLPEEEFAGAVVVPVILLMGVTLMGVVIPPCLRADPLKEVM